MSFNNTEEKRITGPIIICWQESLRGKKKREKERALEED